MGTVQHITREEVLMGREVEFPLTPELEANLTHFLEAINKFRDIYGKPMVVTSGYRPGYYNTRAGGAKHSAHIVCMACDFADGDGTLDAWVDAHPDVLVQCGLWREAPSSTPGWIHLDTHDRGDIGGVPGKRTFIP